MSVDYILKNVGLIFELPTFFLSATYVAFVGECEQTVMYVC